MRTDGGTADGSVSGQWRQRDVAVTHRKEAGGKVSYLETTEGFWGQKHVALLDGGQVNQWVGN